MNADASTLHIWPEFREKLAACLVYLNTYLSVHHPGYSAKMIEGFRSTARQKELYAEGRTTPGPGATKDNPLGSTVTQKNGTTNPSNHQSAMAGDIGIFKNGKYIEEPPSDIWAQLQHAAHVNGLTSGSDWHGFVDQPHLEWPHTDIAAYKEARVWKQQNGLV